LASNATANAKCDTRIVAFSPEKAAAISI